jgi:hypothetical protein
MSERADPSRITLLKDKDEAKLALSSTESVDDIRIIPKTENALPSRQTDRRDKDAPRCKKSNTDRDAPRRA